MQHVQIQMYQSLMILHVILCAYLYFTLQEIKNVSIIFRLMKMSKDFYMYIKIKYKI